MRPPEDSCEDDVEQVIDMMRLQYYKENNKDNEMRPPEESCQDHEGQSEQTIQL
jgi:hypothetical protein